MVDNVKKSVGKMIFKLKNEFAGNRNMNAVQTNHVLQIDG